MSDKLDNLVMSSYQRNKYYLIFIQWKNSLIFSTTHLYTMILSQFIQYVTIIKEFFFLLFTDLYKLILLGLYNYTYQDTIWFFFIYKNIQKKNSVLHCLMIIELFGKISSVQLGIRFGFALFDDNWVVWGFC